MPPREMTTLGFESIASVMAVSMPKTNMSGCQIVMNGDDGDQDENIEDY
jgi:hypothetical protein